MTCKRRFSDTKFCLQNPPSRRLPAWPYARLPWPKTAVFTWKSPGFSCLLPACLALAAAACASLACLPGLVFDYRQAVALTGKSEKSDPSSGGGL